jgi:hypothetical protein
LWKVDAVNEVLDRIEQQIAEELIELAPGEISLDLLRRVYRSTQQPMSMRMRAAIEALPFEVPKLSATVIATMDGKTFAEALERCIERSQSPPQSNGSVQELPAEELKKPMSRYRRF